MFIFELVAGLGFEVTEKTGRIRRENCLVTLPMVEGEEHGGNQLPLKVSLVDFLESKSSKWISSGSVAKSPEIVGIGCSDYDMSRR